MGSLGISRERLFEMMHQAIIRSAFEIPEDVERSIREAYNQQVTPLSRLHLELTLANIDNARKTEGLACGDTGFPLYYVVLGKGVEVEGGLWSLYEVSREAVRRATEQFRLRATMVHPLTRQNPRTNCGYFIPGVEVRFDPRFEGMKIVAVLKGGGAEIYGSYFKMMLAADGREGATKFILDSVRAGAEEGKTCPPSIVGVGIGGTSDICMRMAKEAAVLRSIGSHHPEKEIAQYEAELMEAINGLGIGPMGTGGKATVLAVNVEYAVVHTGALPVAFSSQCSLCRRATGHLSPDGDIQFVDDPRWRES